MSRHAGQETKARNVTRSLLNMTIEEAATYLQEGAFTSVDLTQAYLARIEEAKEFNAVIEINPDALEIARKLDEERCQGINRGILHGIPILVKDNIVTEDSLHASAGSFALLGAKPEKESALMSRLRQAGIIVLGKSNMSEWANFRGLNITDGWSPRGGQTLGVYHPNSNPEGSSSGSAVATALGLSMAALGTETWGSVTMPAERNNVIGFKPTRGFIGTEATIPISNRQDVIGTLTRTVMDAAYLLNQMVGRSERDERTWNIPVDPIPDFTQFCQGVDLSGLRLGIPRNAFADNMPAAIMDAFSMASRTFTSAGAAVIDDANFTAADEFRKLNQQVKGIVRSSEFKRDIVKYLDCLTANPNEIKSVEDIINFTKSNDAELYPEKDIGKFLWTQAEGVEVDSDKYKHMLEQEAYFGGEGGILGALEKYKLDALILPSTNGIAGDLAAKMGFPILVVPLGFWPAGTEIQKGESGLTEVAPGMPFCLTLISKSYDDEKLLQIGHAFEKLAAVRSKGPEPFWYPATEIASGSLSREEKM